MTGTINHIPRFKEDGKARYFAFIKVDNKSYFFHVSKFNGDWKDLVDAVTKGSVKVNFEIDDEVEGKLRAKDVVMN